MHEKLGALLVRKELLTSEQVEDGLKAQLIYGGRLGSNLAELGVLDLDVLGRCLSEQRGIPLTRSPEIEVIKPPTLALLSAQLAEKHLAIPLRLEGRKLYVAMASPWDPAHADELAFRTGFRIVASLLPELRVLHCLERFYGITRPARYIRIREDASPRRDRERAAAPAPARATPGVLEPPSQASQLFGSLRDGEYLAGEDLDLISPSQGPVSALRAQAPAAPAPAVRPPPPVASAPAPVPRVPATPVLPPVSEPARVASPVPASAPPQPPPPPAPLEVSRRLSALGVPFTPSTEGAVELVRHLGPQTARLRIERDGTIRWIAHEGVEHPSLPKLLASTVRFDPSWAQRIDFDLALDDHLAAVLGTVVDVAPSPPPPAASDRAAAGSERRQHPRIDVRAAVDLAGASGLRRAQLTNLSVSGAAFVIPDAPPAVGDTLALLLPSLGDEDVGAIAQVKRVEAHARGTLVGVMFVQIEPDGEKALVELLAMLTKKGPAAASDPRMARWVDVRFGRV